MKLSSTNVIPFTDAQHAAMIELYQGGASSRQISAIYGISQAAVLRRLRCLGVRIRRMGIDSERACRMASAARNLVAAQ